jgi:hypothetical protein
MLKQKMINAWKGLSLRLEELALPETFKSQLMDWHKVQSRFLSEAIHPTFDASVYGIFALKKMDSALFKLNPLGEFSAFSIGTLDTAMKAIWFFSQVSGKAIITRGQKSIEIPNLPENLTTEEELVLYEELCTEQ